MIERISVSTRSREEFIDITAKVRKIVDASGVSDGLCVVYVPHTTAGLTVNENADPNVSRDMLAALGRLVPRDDPDYRHAEGNSDSHLKSTLVGFSHMIPISDGALTLGTWQGIFFCEFDGPRQRSALVQIAPTAREEA